MLGVDSLVSLLFAAPRAQIVMPEVVLDADQEEAALKKGGADLQFLLAKQEVSKKSQAVLYHVGVTTVEKFANLASGRDDLVKVLKEYLNLDQDESLAKRVEVAGLLCAHANAQTRTQKAAEVEAEYDSKEWAKPVVPGEWQAMKTALEKRLGAPLDDKLCPAKEYLEKKLAEVEAGEYRAEALTEVVSKDEVDPDALLPVWDSKGNITVKRGASTVGEPQNAESLRRRLTLVRNCLMMIAVKHTNRPELQGDYLDVMEQYKDYILGEYVYGLHARDPEGSTIAVPPWTLVLAYEKAVRKQAMKLATTYGTPIPVALKEAWRDATVKERNFTTPLALYSKRPMPFQGGDKEHKYQRGDGPPKKGDGKGKKAPKGCSDRTPSGQQICFQFNTKGEKCKAKKCKFAHVCGACHSDKHPMYACTHRTRQDAADTQGSG